MIIKTLLIGLLLAAALLSARGPALAQGLDQYSNCGKSSWGIECGRGFKPATDPQARVISAARADALKKRQLTELIRQNEGNLFRDQANLTPPDTGASDRKL